MRKISSSARFLFRRGIIVQPPRELAQDRLLAVPAHADNERHGEFFAVGVVEAMEIGKLLLAEPVEPGRGLFGRRVGGELAFPRRLAGEIGMAVDQRLPPFRRRVAHCIRHGLIERRDAREWPPGKRLLRHPGRELHHLADRRHEGLAVGGVEGLKTYLFHAATLFRSASIAMPIQPKERINIRKIPV